MHCLRTAVVSIALAMAMSGCAATQRVPVSFTEHTYLGDAQPADLKLRYKRVAGMSCDQYVPFLNIQLEYGTTEAAYILAMNQEPDAVGLANVTVEVEHKVNGLGFLLLERCIVVTGQPLLPAGKTRKPPKMTPAPAKLPDEGEG